VAGTLLLGQISFFVLFALIITGGLLEYFDIASEVYDPFQKWLGVIIGLGIFTLTFFHAQRQISSTWFLLIFAGFFLVSIADLLNKKANPMNTAISVLGITYIAGSLSTTNYLVFNKSLGDLNHYHFEFILSIFIITWMNDTMAYLTGSKLGKHSLIKRISPKKTWEGTIGGFVFACIVTLIISHFFLPLSLYEALILGAIISVSANLGDLFESSLKRNAGKKDSGKLLPGHGGVLDRFDAAIFAIPFSFFYIHFFI
jgi:phosphatidate cytidylyltransferase